MIVWKRWLLLNMATFGIYVKFLGRILSLFCFWSGDRIVCSVCAKNEPWRYVSKILFDPLRFCRGTCFEYYVYYSLGIGVSQDYRFQYDGSMFYVALSWGITARDPKPAEGWGVPLHSMRPTFFITFQRFVPGGPLPVISEVITPYKYVASVIQLFSAIYRGPISPYL